MLRRLQKEPQDDIAQLFYQTFLGLQAQVFQEHYVAIGQAHPDLSVLCQKDGLPVFANMRWGLPWRSARQKASGSAEQVLVNTTCEKLSLLHGEILPTQRCVVPLDGYYEFFHFAGQVYPHFIHAREGLLYAGGIWDERVDSQKGEAVPMMSLITTPPNTLARRLHNNPKAPHGSRMLLLLSHTQILDFLDPGRPIEALQDLFQPFPDDLLDAYPVRRFLRKDFADQLQTPRVRDRIDYPELAFSF